MLSDAAALPYLDGIAYHWYADGMDRGMDGSYGWRNVQAVSDLLVPLNKFVMSSESCHCPRVDHTADGSWTRAERMAHDIIADFNTGTSSWIDWYALYSNHYY
jgi:glucosylceramidase